MWTLKYKQSNQGRKLRKKISKNTDKPLIISCNKTNCTRLLHIQRFSSGYHNAGFHNYGVCILELTCILSPSLHIHGWLHTTRSTPTDILLLINCWEPIPPAAPGTWCSCLGADRDSLDLYIVNVTSPFTTSKSHVITEFFWGTCMRTWKRFEDHNANFKRKTHDLAIPRNWTFSSNYHILDMNNKKSNHNLEWIFLSLIWID